MGTWIGEAFILEMDYPGSSWPCICSFGGIRISSSLKKEPERQAIGPFRRGRGAETVSVRVEPCQAQHCEVLGVFQQPAS